MLKSEGMLAGVRLISQIDLSTMLTAITSIAHRYGRMIVECEERDEDLEDFYIGQVASIDDGKLYFDHFDGLGLWAETASAIPLDDITMLQFETPYLQRFWKYLRGPAPSEVNLGNVDEKPRPQ